MTLILFNQSFLQKLTPVTYHPTHNRTLPPPNQGNFFHFNHLLSSCFMSLITDIYIKVKNNVPNLVLHQFLRVLWGFITGFPFYRNRASINPGINYFHMPMQVLPIENDLQLMSNTMQYISDKFDYVKFVEVITCAC
jgi:hypothetical protein